MAKPNVICGTCKGKGTVDAKVLDTLFDPWSREFLWWERNGRKKCPTCKGKRTLGKV